CWGRWEGGGGGEGGGAREGADARWQPGEVAGRLAPHRRLRSIRIGAEDLTSVAATQGVVGDEADALLEEVDRSVGEEHVGPTGMVAGEALGRRPVAAAQRRDGALPLAVAVRIGGRERVGVPAAGAGPPRGLPGGGPEGVVGGGERPAFPHQ